MSLYEFIQAVGEQRPELVKKWDSQGKAVEIDYDHILDSVKGQDEPNTTVP